ncbi:short-chain fatty acids transporter [Robiginitalea myxolifaciens]|uniref:Short-chain fatty acids transporter n=1 Tax=Robiginitalea myxolifaciens TaxID=400055 RepID=A0A1I6G856_9FLAO|nr:TIGR00366 family protein [Robiginitalea myxolifaciens]SFR38388.1 short-chain fatty acids transporter [Robiginitalea myxolifaciens]
MGISKLIATAYRRFLPSPLAIAILLTALTVVLALAFGRFEAEGNALVQVLDAWEKGLWNRDLLVFAYQMMLILVLGHVLVLSRPAGRLINRLTSGIHSNAQAAVIVGISTMLVAFFNWGLGLIFGAILARKVGEAAHEKGLSINYPLIGACGYLGLMVWHGGISGSAPIKASEAGHVAALLSQNTGLAAFADLPSSISTSATIFSIQNLLIFAAVLTVCGLVAYTLGKRDTPSAGTAAWFAGGEPGSRHISAAENASPVKNPQAGGAERIDRSPFVATGFALLIFGAFLLQYLPALRSLNLNPDMLNLFMLGLAVLLHGSLANFGKAVEEAIGDTSGILIQFPLYFGIMGIMNNCGLVEQISDLFVQWGTPGSLPILTFFSAGLVNIFVPSGGGQWAVQGPIFLEAALKLDIPLSKALMALAYGDQLTNMLQPFWALPLLGITRLKAREILPYSLIFMLAGGSIYLLGLLLW